MSDSIKPELDLADTLGDIRTRTEGLHMPRAVYAGLRAFEGGLEFICADRTAKEEHKYIFSSPQEFLDSLALIEKDKHCVVIAVGIEEQLENAHDLGARLWLDHDCVPLFYSSDNTMKLARFAWEAFDEDESVLTLLKDHRQVVPSFLVTHKEYRGIVSDEVWQHFVSLVEEMRGSSIAFVSATPRGGGVALMRHALMRLFDCVDVRASWHVLEEDAEAFLVTKTKFHNVLQAVSDSATRLTAEDKEHYESWIAKNWELLKEPLMRADVVVIDDPQPAGLIPYIKEYAPGVCIVYRSHIQIEAELCEINGTAQYETWRYLLPFIKEADVFVAHPVEDFIPSSVDHQIVCTMPASTDPLDGLNKRLPPWHTHFWQERVNALLLESGQEPLRWSEPYIVQIARFDPSKGIDDVLEAYRLLAAKFEKEGLTIPQLVLAGHGSVDDPDGAPVFNLTRTALTADALKPLADKVKLLRLPAHDQMLNVILRGAKVALQLSHKEGFEIKVTEALEKGVPVVVYGAGGIPLQVQDNTSGFVVDEIGNTETVADLLFKLLTDHTLFQKLSRGALQHARRDLFTVPQATRWLWLARQLLSVDAGVFRGNAQSIDSLMRQIQE